MKLLRRQDIFQINRLSSDHFLSQWVIGKLLFMKCSHVLII